MFFMALIFHNSIIEQAFVIVKIRRKEIAGKNEKKQILATAYRVVAEAVFRSILPVIHSSLYMNNLAAITEQMFVV